MKLASNTIACATALTCGAALFGVSTSSYACTTDPIMSSICAMALPQPRFQTVNNTYTLAAGQLIPINQNTALFSLLGTTFGGDGVSTFSLPDLRGRVIVGYGANTAYAANVGQVGGNATVLLTVAQLPPHVVTFANTSVNISGLTASTALSGLAATANLAGVALPARQAA